MAYITSYELEEITNLKINVEEDINFDAIITRAQKELESRLGDTFTSTDSDWIIVQRALAFLTAYYIRLERKENEYAKEELKEYERLIKILAIDNDPEKQEYWEPSLKVINQEDLTT